MPLFATIFFEMSIPTTLPLNAKGGVTLPLLKIFYFFYFFYFFSKFVLLYSRR
jgi:hypothetical protein